MKVKTTYYYHIFLLAILVHVEAKSGQQLKGKVAVVTGGAKGIGYAIADNFLKNNAKVVIIVDINKQRGLQAEKELNIKYGANTTVFIYGDVTKDLKRVWKIIIKTYGCIDILVNNAGIFNECDPEKTINTNALAPVLWTRKFFECMRKDKGGKGGTVIIIASISAYTAEPFYSFYKTSKFAVLGLALGLGHEYNFMFSGVRIFAICPGLTQTDLILQPVQILVGDKDVYKRLLNNSPSQLPDDVGRAAALLYKTAGTGKAYTVEGGAPPVESPARVNITLEQLLN